MPPDVRTGGDRDAGSGGVYVEFSRVGNAIKVAVIDADTGVEAFVLGPLTASRADLQTLAIAKLRRQLGVPHGGVEDAGQTTTAPKRGIIV